jgi:GNAT superfamily N-acetyltransferase
MPRRDGIVTPVSADVDLRHAIEPEQVEELLALYAQAWWARERTAAGVREMLASTDLVFALVEPRTDRLVGFARVLTDGIYRAFLYDVIVDEAHRSSGLGRVLVDAIVGDPRLARVGTIELACQPELVPFYRRWGFVDGLGGSTLMRRVRD